MKWSIIKAFIVCITLCELTFQPAPQYAYADENDGAIIISGKSTPAFNGDVSRYYTAATSNDGLGISTGNIILIEGASLSDFNQAITTMNNNGISNLYIHVSSHGLENKILLGGQRVSADDFAEAISNSEAENLTVTIAACYSGSLINEISSATEGKNLSIFTSSDEKEDSYYFTAKDENDGYFFFTKELLEYLMDPSDQDSVFLYTQDKYHE